MSYIITMYGGPGYVYVRGINHNWLVVQLGAPIDDSPFIKYRDKKRADRDAKRFPGSATAIDLDVLKEAC